jgi:predicted dehydrogenase
MDPLRIGTLGAARITPMALLRPARRVPEATVVAVAARDAQRAQRFAKKHSIPKTHSSYEALIADPEIEAVYNPLPNSHHLKWTIKALEAGKHVLCEKPLASNAGDARTMADAAAASGRVLMEAFHWRYHPLAARIREIIDSGELGRIRHLEAHFCIPLWIPGDIRYRLELAGGATMDTGCYAVSILRFLAAAEPRVVRAEAKELSPGIDRYMAADFQFEDGRTGRITCALLSAVVFRAQARVVGELGEMTVLNPVVPQFFHRLRVVNPTRSRTEHVRGDATYTHQLRAFVGAVREGKPFPTDGAHGVANMQVIDEIYRRAGMQPRGSSA